MTLVVRAGLAGAGSWATMAHLPALVASDAIDLVAIADPDPSRVETLLTQLGSDSPRPRIYRSLDRLLAESDVDLIDICAPPARHFELASAALAAGKHVLCEKPLGEELSEAEELCAAASSAGVKTAMGFTFRHAPLVQGFKRLIDEGYVGEIRVVHGFEQNALYRDPAAERPAAWLRSGDHTGALDEYGSHLVDLVRWVAGEIVEVAAHARTFVPFRMHGDERLASTLDDSTLLLCALDNGAHAMLGASWITPGRPPGVELRVYGDRGALTIRLVEGEEHPLQGTTADDGTFRPIAAPTTVPTIGAGLVPARGCGAERRAGTRPAPTVPVAKERGGSDHSPDVGGLHNWPREYMGRLIEDFGRAILLDRPVNGSFEDGLQCRRILDAAALAARERRWVEVGDVASTPCQALGSGS